MNIKYMFNARNYLHDVIRKALQTRLVISPMFLFAKTLRMAMTYDDILTFECLKLTPFCLEKSSVRKEIFYFFSSVFSANLIEIK